MVKIFGRSNNNYSGCVTTMQQESSIVTNDSAETAEQLLTQNDSVKIIGNQIYLYDDISDKSLLKLKQCLRKVNKKLDQIILQLGWVEPNMFIINIHIASNGGCCFSGLHMYDTIKENKYTINTYIDGFAASAATFPFLAGKNRYISENSYVMIHQLSSLVSGTYQNLKDQLSNCQKIMESFKKVYLNELTIEKEQLDVLLSKDLWLTKVQANKLGFQR